MCTTLAFFSVSVIAASTLANGSKHRVTGSLVCCLLTSALQAFELPPQIFPSVPQPPCYNCCSYRRLSPTVLPDRLLSPLTMRKVLTWKTPYPSPTDLSRQVESPQLGELY